MSTGSKNRFLSGEVKGEILNQNRQKNIKNNLILRSEIIHEIRLFFRSRGFIEVDTPARIPIPIPEAYIDPVSSDGWFLQSSPEQCMKRLIAAKYDKIFQICKCFRKNERGSKHLPELTMLEWYQTNLDYKGLMEQCEDLVIHIASKITGTKETLIYGNKQVSLKKPWTRLKVSDAFKTYANESMEQAVINNTFDEITGLSIEPELGFKKPVFLYDYPAEKAALAKLKESNAQVAERFELYINGLELCNAFSELNNSEEQRKRFKYENEIRTILGQPEYLLPGKFLDSIDNMPDTAGIAFGIDRLVMLFTNTNSIDDITAFTPEEL